MIGLTIAFPQMVMHYKGAVVDPGDVEIVLPPMGGGQTGLPGLGQGCRDWTASRRPVAGPRRLRRRICRSRRASATSRHRQPAPPATDLSKPPSFN